jgi:hypothetical protein
MQPGTVFAVRRSFKGIALFLVAFDAMAVCGILLLPSRPLAGAGLIAFGLLIEAAHLLQAIRPRWRYAVGPEGIEVRRTLRSHVIPRDEISSVEKVDGTEIQEILSQEQWAEVGAGRSMDVGAGLRAGAEPHGRGRLRGGIRGRMHADARTAAAPQRPKALNGFIRVRRRIVSPSTPAVPSFGRNSSTIYV